MANKFVTQQSLTMLTAEEVKSLTNASQINIAEDETLIYKYRDEFLHIQRAAEQGVTDLEMLLENPTEFAILATAWGFNVTVQDRYDFRVVYKKNLGKSEIKDKISNIQISWQYPNKPTVDVAYYREKGNLVTLLDSTLFVPKLDRLKTELGVSDGNYQVDAEVVTAKKLAVAKPAAVTTTVTKTVDTALTATTGLTTVTTVTATPVAVEAAPLKPNYQENFGWEGSYLQYTGLGRGAYFQIVASSANGKGLPYRFYLGNNRPQGATGLNSSGYSAGETITVSGGLMGGTVANNAVITVETVNSAGAILSARVSGITADGFVSGGRYTAPSASDPTTNS